MNRPRDDEPDLPLYEPEEGASYSLDVIARMSGVSAETIVHYQEKGLIPTAAADSADEAYDEETLRTLRRIDHLRSNLEVNEAGLRLILGLMEELEKLRASLNRKQ